MKRDGAVRTSPEGHGIRRRLLLLMGVGALLPAALLSWAALAGLDDESRRRRAQHEAEVLLVADRVDDLVREGLQRLAAAGPAWSADGASDALREVLVRGHLFRAVAIVDARGAPLLAHGAMSRFPDEERQALVRDGTPRVTGLREAPGGPLAWMLVPIRDWRGEVSAVAVGELTAGDGPLARVLAEAASRLGADVDLVGSVEPSATRSGGSSRPMLRDEGTRPFAAEASLATAPWTVRLRPPAGAAPGPAETLRARLIVAVPLLLALSAVFAYGAARSVIDPLGALTRAAESVARGEIDRPVPDLPADEVGRLGRAVETMRAALARSLSDLRSANLALEFRVQERTRQVDELNRELLARDAARGRLLAKVITAQEEERKRIARELHDDTGQMLSALLLGLRRCEAALDAGEARRALEDARGLAGRAVEGVHRLIHDLRPSVLDDLGLVAAVRWYAQRHLEPRGLAVRCEVDPFDQRLPAQTETALFRAVQEALMNVARHAQAENVLIQISVTEGGLQIEVEDDGAGFDPAEMTSLGPSGRGLGLMGIRERLDLVGGSARIESAPGQGTRVVLRVPAPRPSEADPVTAGA